MHFTLKEVVTVRVLQAQVQRESYSLNMKSSTKAQYQRLDAQQALVGGLLVTGYIAVKEIVRPLFLSLPFATWPREEGFSSAMCLRQVPHHDVCLNTGLRATGQLWAFPLKLGTNNTFLFMTLLSKIFAIVTESRLTSKCLVAASQCCS